MNIEWKEPPRTGSGLHKRGDGRNMPIVRALIERSGQWALIRTCTDSSKASSHASRITRGVGSWQGHRWECVTRKEGDVVNLYVRHLGPIGDES